MTAEYSARFSVLLLYIVSVACSESSPNICPKATGCKCTNAWRSLSTKQIKVEKIIAECNDVTDPKLQFLPKENLEKVLLRRNTFTNISLLNTLRNTDLRRFTLIQNKFANEERPMFDWDWLPRTVTNLSLTENGFYGFQKGPNHDCTLYGFDDQFSLLASHEKFSGIPNCLPENVNKINLMNLQGNQTEDETTWPRNLALLRVVGGRIPNLFSRLFKNEPPSLVTLWISHQKHVNDSWVTGLPVNTLKRLFITHSELKELPKLEMERFEKANVLQHLWLSYNKLTDLPQNLPASLKSLRMDNNKIRHITAERWSSLKNLVLLDLHRNNLIAVPMEMPSTLAKIYMGNNEIYISNADAFRHLRDLKFLDLSYNKLTKLPEGIQPGLENYVISGNQISLVNSPSEYNFCTECSYIQLFGNPWHCNVDMLKMLNWFVLHNVYVQDVGQGERNKEYLTFCNQIEFRGVDNSWLQSAMEFMEYFRKPPNNKCIYEILTLSCIDVNLSELPKRIPPGLEVITIMDNPELAKVPDYKFSNQTVLTQLRLNNNSLSHIPVGLPSSLLSLSLNDNNLGNWTNKDLHALHGLTLLRYLYLADNNIKVLYSWQFEGLTDLVWIALAGNPLHCDCSMQSFSYYFDQIVPVDNNMIARQYPMCKTPSDHENVDIRHLTGYYSYGINCIPHKCGYNPSANKSGGILNCSKAFQNDETKTFIYGFVPGEKIHVPTSSFWIQIDLSGLELRSNKINYKNLSRLEIVDLSRNLLLEIPFEGLPAAVKFLNLSHNEIAVLPSHKIILRHLPKIRTLDLTFNQIKIITPHVSNFEVISNLFLYGNPLICDCSSTPLIEWVHVNLDSAIMAERHHLRELTCQIEGEPRILKISEMKDTGYCQTLPLVPILGGVTAFVILSLLTVVLANVYYQQKRSEKVNAEILLGFQGLLQREVDEEDPELGISKQYKFDAFISYDPDGLDAEFVLSLLEELEDKRGYRLCLSERDFVPGAGVTDNIVECISESKHVVLVLSRSFIASPWCQCEVQAALAELQQRRRSQLLIAVLLEDISVDEDTVRSVKTLLSLTPGLTAPQYMPDEGKEWQEFWKRLIAMMPHSNSQMEA